MARKDIFALHRPSPTDTESPPANADSLMGSNTIPSGHVVLNPPPDNSASLLDRPLLGMIETQPVALRAISQSLEAAGEKVRRAAEIEEQLAKGFAVVELDPTLIDAALVSDRMGIDADSRAAFIAAIREQGQKVPILVRPKPNDMGRYQIAYGSRRLDAARVLGRTVLAVVRALSDDELVIAQGQENAVRADLSFIERTSFAAKLEEGKFSRETIIAALGIDRTLLSRMLTLIERIPPPIVEAIGPAPAAGRPRWIELADLLNKQEPKGEVSNRQRALALISTQTFLDLETNQRFEALRRELSRRTERATPKPIIAADGARIARIVRSTPRLSLAFDDRATPNFGEFVASRLVALYDEFRAAKPEDSVN